MRSETYPSKEFSDYTGLYFFTDWVLDRMILFGLRISKRIYIFNEELNYKLLNRLVILFINISYKRLIKLNPELSNIKVNSWVDKMNLIAGAISKYPFNDIKFFVENYDNIKSYNRRVDSIKKKITYIFGKYPEWVLSPATLRTLLLLRKFK